MLRDQLSVRSLRILQVVPAKGGHHSNWYYAPKISELVTYTNSVRNTERRSVPCFSTQPFES